MAILWSNNASSTVAGSITATATSVALAAGTGIKFPNPTGGDYFVATFYDQATKTLNEIVHVTARSGDTCTIVRGQEGTTPQVWSAADIFANLVTAGTLAAFVQAGTGPADTSLVYVGTDVSPTANLIIATTNPVPHSYQVGMLFNILVKNVNTGPTYLQLNGLAGVRASRTDGSDLVGGNLHGSEEMAFIYNGVDFTSLIPPVPQIPPQTIFYVRSDGNDNNSGFANTPQDAFRTVSGAMFQISARYISQTGITIRVADGLYQDGFGAGTGYISSWNVTGNPTNPGNCVFDTTSTNAASYPPHSSLGSCCGASGSGIMSASGFYFKSYFNNCGTVGGTLDLNNIWFSPSINGQSTIGAGGGGNLGMYGSFRYIGTNPNFCLLSSGSGGSLNMGYYDNVFTNDPFTMNIAAGAVFTGATVIGEIGGIVSTYDAVCSWIGAIPNCPQYAATSGGGIYFLNGNTTIFPGSQPGYVTPPGWIATG
jgi:hypothetical protein